MEFELRSKEIIKENRYKNERINETEFLSVKNSSVGLPNLNRSKSKSAEDIRIQSLTSRDIKRSISAENLPKVLLGTEVRSSFQSFVYKRAGIYAARAIIGEPREIKTEVDANCWERLQFQLDASLFTKGLVLGLAPSMVDVVSDIFSVKHFIQGDFYLKRANNTAEFLKENCSFVSETITKTIGMSNETIVEKCFTYLCFETDPVFGKISLFLIYLPSALAVGKIILHYRSAMFESLSKIFRKHQIFTSVLMLLTGVPCCVLGVIIFCAVYPILVMAIKGLNMFTRNKTVKALAVHCSSFEGICESSLQFALQLFIAFTLTHRQPSTTQLVSMTASGIMVSKTLIDREISTQYTQKGISLSLEEEIGKSILLLPVFACGTVGVIGSIAVSSSLLRYNYITFIIFIFLFLGLVDLATNKLMGKHRSMIATTTSVMTFQFLLQSILLIIVNASPDSRLSKFYPFSQEAYKLSSMPLVQNSDLFNYIVIIIMLCQAASFILYYFQLYKPSRRTTE